MLLIKNLREYKPENPKFGVNVVYLKDDDGNDWYDTQKQFSKDTFKVAYDSSGVIVGAGYNIGNPAAPDSFWPDGLSVAEVTGYPNNFSAFTGQWVFNEDKKQIERRQYSNEEVASQVDALIKKKIQEVVTLISPLQFAVDLDMADEKEKAKLKSLQKYVVLLNRVPQQETYPTGVSWPEIPTT